jgi:hypothetical protein
VQRMRRSRFFLNGHQYKFGWSPDHFAKVNGLPAGDPVTQQAYQTIASAAESDMEIITAAIMKGSVRKRSIYMKGFGQLASLSVLGVDWEAVGVRCDDIK